MERYSNQAVAELLKEIAAAYIVKKEDRFRIMAYENAAASIEHATSEVKDLWDDHKLDSLAGVGPNIASYLDEFFRTGRVSHFEKIKKSLPSGMFELLKIPGIGPKNAFILAKSLKLKKGKAIINLEEAINKKLVRKIKGFGDKSEIDIYEGIQAYKKGQTIEKRMLLSYADNLALEVISYLKTCPQVLQADALGSLRRMVPTIGDIDIAVQTNDPAKVINWISRFSKTHKILSKGETALMRIILDNGKQVDFRFQSPDSYGAMLQYFTGGKSHNISLRQYAITQNKSLSEYGIKTNKRLNKISTEEAFYRDLNMDWIPPELREDRGEIEIALKHKLPSLVKHNQIKGDLHLHSNFPIETSHDLGVDSYEILADKAESLNYEYLGCAEHNPSVAKHTKQKIIDLLKAKKETIDQFNYTCEKRGYKVFRKIFNGLEIDILSSGNLAVSEKSLEFLDYAIGSIHSNFKMSKKQMTNRVIQGLKHPKIKIFGHPTGRMLNRREGYELDWERIFSFCLEKNKWLEINSWPERLDLPDSLVYEAVNKGIKLIINTDSHMVSQLELMKYGVSVARRGWAKPSDILNTKSFTEFDRMLKE